jgi:hypothetical protein
VKAKTAGTASSVGGDGVGLTSTSIQQHLAAIRVARNHAQTARTQQRPGPVFTKQLRLCYLALLALRPVLLKLKVGPRVRLINRVVKYVIGLALCYDTVRDYVFERAINLLQQECCNMAITITIRWCKTTSQVLNKVSVRATTKYQRRERSCQDSVA